MAYLERLRRDPGLILVLLAGIAAFALYAPTLARGLVNYDDPWLIRDNWIVRDASVRSLRALCCDLGTDTRAILGAEYLPVRDLSVMLDAAVWGDHYGGYHATNLLLYLAAIALWFAALSRLGIDRTVAGLAVLLWALHPTHVESVAWLAERKGVLASALAGAVAFAYARYRAGDAKRWLVLALVCAPFAVWSKALAAFAIASLGALELVLPAAANGRRRAWLGLAALATVTAAAFVPVLLVASRMHVVEATSAASEAGGWVARVLGLHGFYVELAVAAIPNAISYPEPAGLDIALGAVALVAAVAAVVWPVKARGALPDAVRAGAMLWLVGWLPSSRIIFPVRLVMAADRYLLFATLGFALIIAAGVLAVPRKQTRVALAAVVCLAFGARTLAAQASWRDPVSLWARAVESNPRDGDAWSQYAEALLDAGATDAAVLAIERGTTQSSSPRLLMHRALLLLRSGDRASGRTAMRQAAEAGEPRAMANLAALLFDDGDITGALAWSRRAVALMPLYVNGHRIRGKIALAANENEEAYEAFSRAYALEPTNLTNRFNLALALIAIGRHADARPHLEACLPDRQLGARARGLLANLTR